MNWKLFNIVLTKVLLLSAINMLSCSKPVNTGEVDEKWFFLGSAVTGRNNDFGMKFLTLHINHIVEDEFYNANGWESYVGSDEFDIIIRHNDVQKQTLSNSLGQHSVVLPYENSEYFIEIYHKDTFFYEITFVPEKIIDSMKINDVYNDGKLIDFEYVLYSKRDSIFMAPDFSGPGQANHDGYEAFPDNNSILTLKVSDKGVARKRWSQIHPDDYEKAVHISDTTAEAREELWRLLLDLSNRELLMPKEAAIKHRKNYSYAKNAINPFYTKSSFSGNIQEEKLLGEFYIYQSLRPTP